MSKNRRRYPTAPGTRVTAAETQAIAGLARGLTIDQIAERLGISPRTVQGRLARAATRMGCAAPHVVLVREAYRRGLLAGLPAEPRPPITLPGRRHDVLCLMADGLTNEQIAHQLGVSEHTVATHVRRLLGQLGATGRAHAVALAIQHQLILIPKTEPLRRAS